MKQEPRPWEVTSAEVDEMPTHEVFCAPCQPRGHLQTLPSQHLGPIRSCLWTPYAALPILVEMHAVLRLSWQMPCRSAPLVMSEPLPQSQCLTVIPQGAPVSAGDTTTIQYLQAIFRRPSTAPQLPSGRNRNLEFRRSMEMCAPQLEYAMVVQPGNLTGTHESHIFEQA